MGGHVIQMLDFITYSSMVTREMVNMAVTMAALHNLEVKAADIFECLCHCT